MCTYKGRGGGGSSRWSRHGAARRPRREDFHYFSDNQWPLRRSKPASSKVAEPVVLLIQFLGLIKRELALVKLLRAGIEGVSSVIHLVSDELTVVSTGLEYRPRGCSGYSDRPQNFFLIKPL